MAAAAAGHIGLLGASLCSASAAVLAVSPAAGTWPAGGLAPAAAAAAHTVAAVLSVAAAVAAAAVIAVVVSAAAVVVVAAAVEAAVAAVAAAGSDGWTAVEVQHREVEPGPCCWTCRSFAELLPEWIWLLAGWLSCSLVSAPSALASAVAAGPAAWVAAAHSCAAPELATVS